jgi:signal transduction histidine kinase
MARDTDIVALVGAGERGCSILEALLRIPTVEVRYFFAVDPAGPGVALAHDHGIRCRTDGRFDELSTDAEVDLILETTGEPDIVEALLACKHPDSCLLGGAGVRLIARLVEAERQTATRLAETNLENARYVRQAAHQLKSPLSSIQSYVNVILGGYTGEIPDRTREIVEKIHSRIDAALAGLAKRRMLADLRCIDRDALEMSRVHLAELIAEAVGQNGALAAEHGIEIRFLPYDGPSLVRCDAEKLATLLSELLENAVLYSRDGGIVEVAIEPQPDGRLAVSIRDHGIGIPARCLPKILDEDYRADPAVKHHPDGAGVGLTIAREIADLHGFRLSVESQEGQGSVVTLTVSLAPTD